MINVSAPWIVCNNPGSYAEEVAVIEAGSEISAYYRGWPHDIGPILTWMAYCGPELTSCASFNGTGKHWFKIAQQGLMSGTIGSGLWAQKDMVNKNFTWTVTIPETLRGGAYLVRHELIALHVPLTPEFYPECAHFFVESKENGEPSQEYLASIPGVWAEEGWYSSESMAFPKNQRSPMPRSRIAPGYLWGTNVEPRILDYPRARCVDRICLRPI